jgi:hypothetical protein
MSKVLGKRGKQIVGPGTRHVIYVCDSTSLPESGNLVWEDGSEWKNRKVKRLMITRKCRAQWQLAGPPINGAISISVVQVHAEAACGTMFAKSTHWKESL